MPARTRTNGAGGWSAWLAAFLTGLLGIAAVVQRPARAERVADSCPLTVDQEVAAVKAVKGFVPAFREPRCLNCHGAVNPFAENGGHLGGYIDIREETREFLRRGLRANEQAVASDLPRMRQVAESRQPITDNDFIRVNALWPMREACQQCHIDGWIIPLKKNQFLNRTDDDLCAHLKTSDLTSPADRFLQHMQDDELIQVAFKGTRGLESGVTPQPPAMSFATLEKFVNAWVDAMGGKFHKPADCGCKLNGLILQIRSRSQDDPNDASSRAGFVDFSGAVEFAVRLVPHENAPGWFFGEASVPRPVTVTLANKRCTGTASLTESWQFRGRMSDDSTSLTLHLSVTSSEEQGTVTCRFPGHTTTDELSVRLFHQLKRVEIRLAGGASQEFEATDPKAREWLTVTVVNVPESR